MITIELARKLILSQFPEYSELTLESVEKQGHDNHTYRLGEDLLLRLPTNKSYALKVPIEQKLLPKLAPHLKIKVPVPIKMGAASNDYPFPFSIYKWLSGKSANHLIIDDETLESIALQLATFLKNLQSINDVDGPAPGQHNYWRGDHLSVYDKEAKKQITELANIIDTDKAMDLWTRACKTKWNKPPVWIHGDFSSGNILIKDNKLSGVIDFGCAGIGAPECDLVIAWTFLKGKSRSIFKQEMQIDSDTWTRAKGWALWKATFELCQLTDKTTKEASIQEQIIQDLLNDKP